MHHTLKKYLYASTFAILIILMSSCKMSGRHISITEKKYETNSAIIEIQIPEFQNIGNDELENKLNKDYNSYINSLTNEFIKKCPDAAPEKYSLRITQNISCDTDRFVSINTDIYEFTEGVHGTNSRFSKTIDILKGEEIELPDFFSDEEYEQRINRIIEEIISENPDDYNDLWEKPMLSSIHNKNFYLSREGIVIYYPPYELSYYARGFVEFCIPYKELSGYLKQDYNFLL